MPELRSDPGRILTIAERDLRFSWPERELIRRLGLVLSGERSEGGQ